MSMATEAQLQPAQANPNNILLEVKGLKKYFPIQKGLLRKTVGYVKAVDDVNFFVREGETLGLVGESGCGKSTAGRTIIRLYEATAGEVLFNSRTLAAGGARERVNLLELPPDKMKLIRREISMVFQDPINSLNPRMTVSDIVAEPMVIHGFSMGPETEEVIVRLLERVGLRPDHLRRYPHEFSGGQRQRIGIARALSLNPSLVICDEPVSALDVSIQAQTLNLLQDLQKDFNLSYIFVAHDLSVVQHISDRVAVMYVGKVAEIANAEELYAAPLHPYTEALLSAVPKADPLYKSERIVMQGDVADPSNPPSGCYFHPRCRYAQDVCKQKTPEFRELKPDHFVACHRAEELKLAGI
ncbi:MAG: ATP-binding cassette domain-containing protein [Chloroflexi bacterium]|nr:MAG: ATP-binding cassette domain-containing protein [Chloroflexota bacterium]